MNNLLLSDLGFTQSCVSLLLRVFIGICFFIHGLGKLGIVGPGNMKGFEGWLKSLNVPKPELQAKMAMLTEIFGGTCLALGLFTRPASIMLLFVMAVACLIGHKGGGYLITNNPPGREYTINLGVVLLAIFMMGPGNYSMDYMLFNY